MDEPAVMAVPEAAENVLVADDATLCAADVTVPVLLCIPDATPLVAAVPIDVAAEDTCGIPALIEDTLPDVTLSPPFSPPANQSLMDPKKFPIFPPMPARPPKIPSPIADTI